MASASPPGFERHRALIRARLDQTPLRRVGPGSITWKVNREVVVIAGWGRAILLQFAHPLVAAGVSDHSTFRGSLTASFRRLHSTVGAMLALTFGDDEAAIGAAAGINCIHDRVSGRLSSPAGEFDEGRRYSAHDPDLLQWVHATLLESVPMAYELIVGPLTDDERDRYCAEAAAVEPLLGIPHGWLPRDSAHLQQYLGGMIGSREIAVTDTSRTLARALLFPPRSYLLWPAFRALRLISIGLLPPGIRSAYGFTWRAREQRAFDRWTGAVRHLRRLAPPVCREWRQARVSDRQAQGLAACRITR